MVVGPDALRRQPETLSEGYNAGIAATTVGAVKDQVSFGFVVRGFVSPHQLVDLRKGQGFTPSLSRLRHVYNSALYGVYCFGTGYSANRLR